MTACVVDASVAAKWFLPAAGETLSVEAVRLLRMYAAGTLRLVVPDLFWPEVGNVFRKAVRNGRMKPGSANDALDALIETGLPTVATAPLLRDAFRIASAFGCSVYDGIYVAAAVARSLPLVTADERLADATAVRLPVRWLGAL